MPRWFNISEKFDRNKRDIRCAHFFFFPCVKKSSSVQNYSAVHCSFEKIFFFLNPAFTSYEFQTNFHFETIYSYLRHMPHPNVAEDLYVVFLVFFFLEESLFHLSWNMQMFPCAKACQNSLRCLDIFIIPLLLLSVFRAFFSLLPFFILTQILIAQPPLASPNSLRILSHSWKQLVSVSFGSNYTLHRKKLIFLRNKYKKNLLANDIL